MFGKVKKVFFTGMFGFLYLSFIAQVVYVLGWVSAWDDKFVCLGFLALEWLVLIAARYSPLSCGKRNYQVPVEREPFLWGLKIN